MNQQELKEKVRKELNTWPTKSVLNEDFDFIWDLYTEINPLKAEDLTPSSKNTEVGSFDLTDNMTKKELLEKIEKLPDDSHLFFDCYDDAHYTNAYVKRAESEEDVARRFITKLYTWVRMPGFVMNKRVHLLEQENEALKKQLNDLKNK